MQINNQKPYLNQNLGFSAVTIKGTDLNYGQGFLSRFKRHVKPYLEKQSKKENFDILIRPTEVKDPHNRKHLGMPGDLIDLKDQYTIVATDKKTGNKAVVVGDVPSRITSCDEGIYKIWDSLNQAIANSKKPEPEQKGVFSWVKNHLIK